MCSLLRGENRTEKSNQAKEKRKILPQIDSRLRIQIHYPGVMFISEALANISVLDK